MGLLQGQNKINKEKVKLNVKMFNFQHAYCTPVKELENAGTPAHTAASSRLLGEFRTQKICYLEASKP
jgi:hypothetical protein